MALKDILLMPPTRILSTLSLFLGYINDFDQPMAYNCPLNQYVSGMESIHSNHYEDRRWKLYCCSLASKYCHISVNEHISMYFPCYSIISNRRTTVMTSCFMYFEMAEKLLMKMFLKGHLFFLQEKRPPPPPPHTHNEMVNNFPSVRIIPPW